MFHYFRQELQQLNDLMPVPGPDTDMEMPPMPTTPPEESRDHLPTWEDWLSGALFANELDKLGRYVY